MLIELVKKAQKGDHEAFSQLIRENTQQMYRIALAHLKNDQAADDAIQETILLCYEHLSRCREADAPGV